MGKEHTNIWKVIPKKDTDLIALGIKHLEWMEMKDYSSATISARRYYLGFFLHWCYLHNLEQPSKITAKEINSYVLYVCKIRNTKSGEILSNNSRSRHFGSVRMFFRWLQDKSYISHNPAQNIQNKKAIHHVNAPVLNKNEIEQVINQADINTPLGLRDRAMMETMYSSGVRRKELIQLKLYDLDPQKGLLYIANGKGNKDRLIPIGKRAVKWIEKYLHEVRDTLCKSPDQKALFLTVSGKSFSPERLSQIAGKYVRKAFPNKQESCHLFRRTMGTLMLESGASIRHIQEILGHAQLSATERYTKVSTSHLKEIHQQTHPSEQTPIAEQPSLTKARSAVPVKRVGRQNQMKIFWSQDPTKLGELFSLSLQYFESLLLTSSTSTLKYAKYHLKWFVQWCHQRHIFSPKEVTLTILTNYQKHVHHLKKNAQPLSSGYRKQRLMYVCQFFKYLEKNYYIFHNPALKIDLPQQSKTLPRNTLTQEKIEKILQQPDTSTSLGIRDRAILEVLYSTAMRRAELVNLTIQDIDFSNQTIVITKGKGGKKRTTPIGKNALYWLEIYLNQVRPHLVANENKNLFLSQYGIPLNPNSLSIIVHDYIKSIGEKGSCHTFRHSTATIMLENGASIRHIQEILGHSSLDTTQIYTKVSIKKLKEVHDKTHPAKHDL